MLRFRRHYLLLRPSTIVIYDELEADHEAEWSWLIHNDTGLNANSGKQTIKAENVHANAMVSLYSSVPLNYNVTDTFSVPARNWNKKVDQEGNLVEFADQWHFAGVSKEKNSKMRYLAIIQVQSKSVNQNCEEVIYDNESGTYTVNGWEIQAELNSSMPAFVKAEDIDKTAAFVSGGNLKFDRKNFKGTVAGSSKLVELVNGKIQFWEAVDEVPGSIKYIMSRN